MTIVALLSVLTFILHLGSSQHYPTKPYHFKYEVADDITGDYHGHTETKAVDGTVSGSYFLLSPDGIWRETKYTDQGYGFEAVQKKTPLNSPPYQRTGSTFNVYQSAGPGAIGAPNSLLGKPVLPGHSIGKPVGISFKAPSKSGIGSQHGFGTGAFDSQRGSGFGSNLGGVSFQGRPNGGLASHEFGGNGGGPGGLSIGGGIDGPFGGGVDGPLGHGNGFSGTGSLGGDSFGGPAGGFGGNLGTNFHGINPSQDFGSVGGGNLGINGPQNFNGGLGNQFGGNQFGGNPFGGNQFGGNQFGGNQFGGNQFGSNQFGNDQFGGNQFREEFDGGNGNIGVPGSGKEPSHVGFGEVSPFGQPGGNAFGGGAIDVGQFSGNIPPNPGADFSGAQGGFPIINGGGHPSSPLGFNNFGNNIDGSSPGFGEGLGGHVGHPEKNVDPSLGKPFKRPEFQNNKFSGGIQGNDAFNAGGHPHELGSGGPPLDVGPVGFGGVNNNAGINLGGDFGRPLSQAGPGSPGGGIGSPFNGPHGNTGATFFQSGGIGFGGAGDDFRASNDIGRPLIPGANLGIGPDVGGPVDAFGNPSLGIGPNIGPDPGFGSDIGAGPGIGRPVFGGGSGPVIGRPSFDGGPDVGPGPGFGGPLLGGGSDIGPGPGFGRPLVGGGPDIGPNRGFGGSFNGGGSHFGSNAGFDESFNGGGSDFGLNAGFGRPLIGGGSNIGPNPGFGRPPIGGGPDVGPGPGFGRPLFGGGPGINDEGLGGPGGFASGINDQGFGGPGGFSSGINDQGLGGPGGFASGINDQRFGGPGGFAGGSGGFQGANQFGGFGTGNSNGVPLFNLGEGANFRSAVPGFGTNLRDQDGVGNQATGFNNGQGNVPGLAEDFQDFVGDGESFGNSGNFGVALENTNNFQRFGNNLGAPQGNSFRVNGDAANNNIFGKRAVPAKRITNSSSLRIAGRVTAKKERRDSNTNAETTLTINKNSAGASKTKRNDANKSTSKNTSDNSTRIARKSSSTNNKATSTDSLTRGNRRIDTNINKAGISSEFPSSIGVASTMQDIFRNVQEGFATL